MSMFCVLFILTDKVNKLRQGDRQGDGAEEEQVQELVWVDSG